MLKTRKYWKIFSLSVLYNTRNYKALLGLSIFLITCLLIFSNLWQVAAQRMGTTVFDPRQLLWYIAFNEWIILSIPETATQMENDLRSGKLAYLLPRPIPYLSAIFAEAMGGLIVHLVVLGFVTFSFTWFSVGHFPLALGPSLMSLGLGLLAGIIGILFQMLIGLSAFWLQSIEPFEYVWEKLLFTLGGLMLPLSVYPEWLQTIAYWSPSAALLGQRSALAIDFSWSAAFELCGISIGWCMIATFGLLWLYQRGLRILNIEGG